MASQSRSNTTFFYNGFQPGADFRLAFINSPVFTARMLAKMAPRGFKSGPKDTLAEIVSKQVESGVLSADAVMAMSASQGCRYLALRKLKAPLAARKLGEARVLLDSFGDGGWLGPFDVQIGEDPANGFDTVYVYTQKVPHYEVPATGQALTAPTRHFRWVMIARLHDDAVSFHWDNFTHNALVKGKLRPDDQFRYWENVDNAIDQLALALGARWQPVKIPELVYDKLWGQYNLKPDRYTLRHLGINADSEGVALIAESSAAMDLKGLQALTHRIAANIVQASSFRDQIRSETALFDEVALQTMLREWGTNSYGFKLSTVSGATELLHARFYMGIRKDLKQNHMACSLAHVRCYAANSGSISAARFLVKHL